MMLSKTVFSRNLARTIFTTGCLMAVGRMGAQTFIVTSGLDNWFSPTSSVSTFAFTGPVNGEWGYTITTTPGQITDASVTPHGETPVPGSVILNGYDTEIITSGNVSGTIKPLTLCSLQAGVINANAFSYGGSVVFFLSPASLNPGYIATDQNRLDYDHQGGAVQLASGAESSQRTLFSFKGARNWNFTLNYNSILARSQNISTPLGMGWSHNFEASIVTSGSSLIVKWDQVRADTFMPSSGNPGVFVSNDDATRYDSITAQSGGGWLLVHRDQSSLLFNSSGSLVEDRDAHGHKLTLTYFAGPLGPMLTNISDPISGDSLDLVYDFNGCLSSLTDGTGASVSFSYQVVNLIFNLIAITDQNGVPSNYAYDSNYQFTTLTDYTGAILTKNTNNLTGDNRVNIQFTGRTTNIGFVYSPGNGNPTTVYTNGDGKTETHIFDSNYNDLSVTDALNETTTYTYDTSNRVTSVTDPLSRTTSYTYDDQGNLLTSSDPFGKVTHNTYDSSNNLLTTTDPLGQITIRTYDSSNNLLTVKDALGRTTTWTYDANSLPLTMTLPRGGSYSYAYTAGLITQARDPNGVITSFGYDANGRILYSQDALNRRTTYTYDGVGNVLTVTNPLNQKISYVCDYRNRVVSITDATGAVSAYTYDAHSNRTTATDPLGNVSHYTYDNEDRLLSIVDPLNLTTAFAYDVVGHLVTVTDPRHQITTYQYDAAGQTTAVVDRLNNTTTKSYDVRGLLSAITDPLSRTNNFTYDALGRLATGIDPLRRQTDYGFDALNRLTQVLDPGSLVASQGYDSDGNRVSLTNPAGAAISFAYDAGDRLTRTTTPAGNPSGYAYDARGLPLTVTQPSAAATTFTYDDAKRLSSYTDPVGTVAIGRDADGRVLTVSEGGKTLTRVYDIKGRLASFTDGNGNIFGYQYDADDRITQITYPGGKTVTYGYDPASRLSTVTDWAGRVTTYTYDNDGRVTKILRPNGSAQSSTYDSAGQLTQLTDLEANQSTVIYSGSYTLDLAGQLTNETITPALTPTTLNVTQTVDVDNRLLTFNGSSVAFDPNGNLLSITSGVAPAIYTYDARNRLTSTGGLSYTYDSENRRVAITESSGTTNLAVNPNAPLDQVLIKTMPNGTQTFYVYGLGLLNEETNGVPTYYHFDRLGNSVALSNSVSAITAQISYGSYGEIISQSGAVATPFLFNGRWGVQTDSNGIYYHRARYYHPQLRRFLNQDAVLGSITTPGSLNRFAYGNGSPISAIDPFGTMALNESTNDPITGTLIELWSEFQQLTNQQGQFVNNNILAPLNLFQNEILAGIGQAGDWISPGMGGAAMNGAVVASLLGGFGEEEAAVRAAETGPATLGELNPGLHPDTMVHLTPFAEADFAGGATPTWWARWGDVSHLTPLEYRIGVVGPAAPGYGSGANLFVTASPEAGAFNLESTSAFGYREFTNTTTVKPSGFFSVPNGPPLPYPEVAIPPPKF